jgi:hypothetical protein
VRSNASEAAYSRGSPNNFERTYDRAKPIRSAGGRAGGYRVAGETLAIIDGTGGLDDRLQACQDGGVCDAARMSALGQ